MPELDFMIVADYVRAEGGVLHMIAAGIDTIYAPIVPATRQVGIGIRLYMTPAEAGHPHQIEIVYQNEDGARLAQINGAITPPSSLPSIWRPGMKPAVAIPFNVSLPLPAYGRYSLELLIDGTSVKSIGITVSEPLGQPGLPGVTGHA